MVRYASGTTTVVNHRKFDAFGNLTAESDSTVKFLYSYTGREWDGDAGLYYYRARWYDAKIGRFISEDPMGFAAGDTNLNRYVGNSTPNAKDPTGLDGQYVWTGSHAEFWYELHVPPESIWSNTLTTSGYTLITSEPARPGLPPGDYLVRVDYWGTNVNWTNPVGIVIGTPAQIGVMVWPKESTLKPTIKLTLPESPGGSGAVNKFVEALAEKELGVMMEEALRMGREAASGIDPNAGTAWKDYDLRTQCKTFAHECETRFYAPPYESPFVGIGP